MNNGLLEPTNNYNLPFIKEELLSPIANAWVYVSAKVQKGEHVMVYYDFPARQLAHLVAKRCLDVGARVTNLVADPEMGEIIAKGATTKDIMRAGSFRDSQIYESDVIFVIKAPVRLNVLSKVPAERLQEMTQASEQVMSNYRVNYTRWQLIYWPTPAEAEQEGLSYEDYVGLWLKAGNQPWSEIYEAQEHLVRLLDSANQLTLIANPNDADERRRTKLEMSIKDMTFINSTIDNNFPGSEVFSSPVKESVNGQLFAAGRYDYQGRIFKDIFMRVESGRVVEASAQENNDELQHLLSRDEGAKYFGEVAFGTNPALRRRLFNGLLNEKVGGSFHITPGRAYEDTIADGKHVDNGNRSQIHWDITVPMLPVYGGGQVLLDGSIIQQDGRWLDPELAVLNKGL